MITDASAFPFSGCDVVVEVLGGLEPARTLVTRALEAGVPVVTANKSLVAARGLELQAVAEAHGTSLYFEAAVLAGVPCVNTLARRPLASGAGTFAWIVNGTSHFVLSAMARGRSFDDALVEAVERGYAEPASTADISGRDAAEKLTILLQLAGHLDVIQGAVIAKDPAVFEPVGFLQNALGGVPSPFDCWLTLRGVKTLELRMERHARNAAAIAEALTRHPRVRRVYYPGLEDHPGHAIAKQQMTGFGGMVSFELDGTLEEASQFVSSLTYFALGESLGGVRSLVCLPCKMTHASIPAETRAELGLSDTLIRLSPWVEHPRDLVGDVVNGLDRLATPGAEAPGLRLSHTPREQVRPVGVE